MKVPIELKKTGNSFDSIKNLKKHYTPFHFDREENIMPKKTKREGTGLGKEFIAGIREKLSK